MSLCILYSFLQCHLPLPHLPGPEWQLIWWGRWRILAKVLCSFAYGFVCPSATYMPALHDFWRHLPTKLCGWWLDWWYPGCCCVAPSTWQSLCSVCPFSCRSCPSLSLLRYLMYPRLLKGQTKYGSSDPWSEPLLFRVRIYYFLSFLSDPPSTFIQCDYNFFRVLGVD